MKKILFWFDQNILTLLTGVLIVFIPLYPKLPLAELMQGYIVRLRLEDLLVLFTFLVWFVQLIRHKVTFPRNKIGRAMLIYLAIGFLSCLSALAVTQTVPLVHDHLFKLVFHYLRRIEYFSLFLITYSAIHTKQSFTLLLKVAFLTLLGVIIYGIGQKYFYFPAFSTMNREFSKGVRLYLEPNTRLLSTFGGHYDLAGYLMMLLSFTLPAAWLTRGKLLKTLFYSTSLMAYWCLVLTTSRTSFIGYLVGITVIAFVLVKPLGWFWSFKHWLVTILISLLIMFSFSNLLERFTQIIPNKDTRETILALQKAINQPFVQEPNGSQTVSEVPSLISLLFQRKPLKTIVLTEREKTQLDLVGSTSDAPPVIVKPTPTPDIPADVTPESEQIRRDAAELQGKIYTGDGYSPNAIKYGLSMGIRLDALWPQAIKGFVKNPLLGTGYSTLVKTNVGEFTYAESTDNDYLRMLGETGLLGTIAFLYIIYLGSQYALFNVRHNSGKLDIISLGFLGATVGLLVTATYIDIFESSKVAYTYWTMTAFVAYLYDQNHKSA